MKIIILVISHNKLDARIQHFRKIWKNICKKNQNPNIKIFLTEYCNELEEEIKEINEFIYIKGQEKIIPNLFYKTIKAIDYINKNYKYDFLLRTNLSTLWNFNKLEKYLKNINSSHYGGIHFELVNNTYGRNLRGSIIKNYNDLFTQGTCINMSVDVVNYLLNNYNDYQELIKNYDDDVVIGKILNKKYKSTNYHKMIKYFERTSSIKSINNLENFIAFRIKINNYPHRDIQVSNLIYENLKLLLI